MTPESQLYYYARIRGIPPAGSPVLVVLEGVQPGRPRASELLLGVLEGAHAAAGHSGGALAQEGGLQAAEAGQQRAAGVRGRTLIWEKRDKGIQRLRTSV